MKTITKLTLAFHAIFALMIGAAVGSPMLAVGLFVSPFLLKFFGVQMPTGAAFGIINPANLTWEGELAQGLSECVYTTVFGDSQQPISKFNKVMTGIKARKQIPFLGQLPMVGKVKAACDVTPNSGTITNTEKFWAPVYITDRLVECWETAKDSFFEWGFKNGIAKSDLTQTDYANFIEQRLSEAISDCIWRNTWFGDTAADESSTGGHLTVGTDEEFFTSLDGLWKQIFAVVAADSTRKISDLATKNAQTTYANQIFNDTDTTNKVATKLLQNLKFSADMRLRDDPNGMILITQSIMDQYERERSAANLESGITILENGMSMVKVGGIPVYSVPFWDRYINTYFNSGAKWYLPHRAVYTTAANIPVGVEEESNLSELDAFYDKVNKKYIIDFGFNMDAKYLQPYMGQFAY